MITNDSSNSDGTHNSAPIEQLAREVLQEMSSQSFDHEFATRAWSRWNARRNEDTVISLMERSARRLVPLAVAASLLVALYSAAPHADVSAGRRSLIERMLGWNDVTSPAQYASASIYDVYGLSSSLGNQ